MDNWLIYALGGGWGHITRALSLGRIAAQQSKVTIITNSPYIEKIGHQDCFIEWIFPDLDFDVSCEQIRNILLGSNYDCLIVDTFPRGLGGELADILPQLQNIPRILIHRDINPRYVTAKNLRYFVITNFNAVIVPGEGQNLPFCDLPHVQHTAPWLIRNAWELPERKIVRSHILKVNNSAKIILVCAAGLNSELPFFSQITQQLHTVFPNCAVRILAANCPVDCPPHLWVSHHPGIECLAAADVVLGGAGYNTVYECTALGVPLVAFAFQRLYDRQNQRAAQVYLAQDLADAIDLVQQLLNKVDSIPPVPDYLNGAVEAVEIIKSLSL